MLPIKNTKTKCLHTFYAHNLGLWKIVKKSHVGTKIDPHLTVGEGSEGRLHFKHSMVLLMGGRRPTLGKVEPRYDPSWRSGTGRASHRPLKRRVGRRRWRLWWCWCCIVLRTRKIYECFVAKAQISTDMIKVAQRAMKRTYISLWKTHTQVLNL